MKALNQRLLLFVLSLMIGREVVAAVRNFTFEGTVASISDFGFQLNGSVTNGAAVKGFYVYEDSAIDQNPDSTVGDYRYTNGMFGITVQIGTYVFRSNPDHTDFLLEVVNRDTDYYLLRSYNNICSTPLTVSHISWQLDNPTGIALSSDQLPKVAPDLSSYASSSPGLQVIGPDLDGFRIRAEITSIATTPPVIPDPPDVTIQEAVELKFQTLLGYFYQIQISTDFENWTNIGVPVLGDGTYTSKFVPKMVGATAYYRANISTNP